MQNFQGLIRNKLEFPRENKKHSCETSRGLSFLALKFLRNVAYITLPNFWGWSFVLPGISRGKEKYKKSFGFFFKIFSKKYVLNPVCFFSGIAYSEKIDLNWYYKELAQKEALTLCQDKAFAPFSCVLSLSLVLGRLTHLHCDTSSLGRGATLHGK